MFRLSKYLTLFRRKSFYLSPLVHLSTAVVLLAILVVCGENGQDPSNTFINSGFISDQSITKSASDGLDKAGDGLNKVSGGVVDVFKRITPKSGSSSIYHGAWQALPALRTAIEANSARGKIGLINDTAEIAIMPDGNPAIAYTDFPFYGVEQSSGPIKVAQYNGSSWEEYPSPGEVSYKSDYGFVYDASNKYLMVAYAEKNPLIQNNIFVKSWFAPKKVWSTDKTYRASSSATGFLGANLLVTPYGGAFTAKNAMNGIGVSFWGGLRAFSFNREIGEPFGSAHEKRGIKKPKIATFISNNEYSCFMGAVVSDKPDTNEGFYGNLQVKLKSGGPKEWKDYGKPLSGNKQTLWYSLTSIRNAQTPADIPAVAINYVEGSPGSADALYKHAVVVWNTVDNKWSEPLVLCKSSSTEGCIGTPSLVYSKVHDTLLVAYTERTEDGNSYAVHVKKIDGNGIDSFGSTSTFSSGRFAHYNQLATDAQGNLFLMVEAQGALNVYKWSR